MDRINQKKLPRLSSDNREYYCEGDNKMLYITIDWICNLLEDCFIRMEQYLDCRSDKHDCRYQKKISKKLITNKQCFCYFKKYQKHCLCDLEKAL